MAITLYGTPISTYVRTVRLVLEETGTDYDLQSVGIFDGENQSPEYLAKHPFGKVPALEADGEIIYETAAIADYLNALTAGRLTPTEPLHLARMRQIIAIIDSYLYLPAVQKIVIQRLVVPGQGGTPDEAVIGSAVAPVQQAMKAIESLAIGTPYLLGDSISLADLHLIPIFVYLSKTPEFAVLTAETPKLKTWWNEVSQLEIVKKVCK